MQIKIKKHSIGRKIYFTIYKNKRVLGELCIYNNKTFLIDGRYARLDVQTLTEILKYMKLIDFDLEWKQYEKGN
jgi:hypothetical protein